jgi:hypothetical protein
MDNHAPKKTKSTPCFLSSTWPPCEAAAAAAAAAARSGTSVRLQQLCRLFFFDDDASNKIREGQQQLLLRGAVAAAAAAHRSCVCACGISLSTRSDVPSCPTKPTSISTPRRRRRQHQQQAALKAPTPPISTGSSLLQPAVAASLRDHSALTAARPDVCLRTSCEDEESDERSRKKGDEIFTAVLLPMLPNTTCFGLQFITLSGYS